MQVDGTEKKGTDFIEEIAHQKDYEFRKVNKRRTDPKE
jgi:hypothetical protein